MMQEEREPIGSNIHDAISFMTKEIERREAVMDASALSFLNGFSPRGYNFLVWGLAILIGFIGYESTHDIAALFWALSPILTATFLYWICTEFNINRRRRDTLIALLPDLKKLYQYDFNMDVGFQLIQLTSHETWFDETVLKAMMKKREKEIRRENPSPETSEQQNLQAEADKYRAEVERLKAELEAKNKK
jgi:hypothetical protein